MKTSGLKLNGAGAAGTSGLQEDNEELEARKQEWQVSKATLLSSTLPATVKVLKQSLGV